MKRENKKRNTAKEARYIDAGGSGGGEGKGKGKKEDKNYCTKKVAERRNR